MSRSRLGGSSIRRLLLAALIAALTLVAVLPTFAVFSLPSSARRLALDDDTLVRVAVVEALPSWLPASVREDLADLAPTSHIVPGLDVQGGVQLLLAVDVDAAIAERERRLGASGIADDDPDWRGRLRTDALQQAQRIVKARVDALHVAEPSIIRRGDRHLQVQLPGSTDPASARALLGRTARLTFHRVVDDPTILGDDVRAALPPTATLEERAYQRPSGALATDRFVTLAATEADRVLAALSSHLPDHLALKLGPADDDVVAVGAVDVAPRLRTWLVEKEPALGGETVTDARVATGGPEQPGPVVVVQFDPVGSAAFATLTSGAVGERIAIVLDDRVDSAPVVQEPITGGTCSIRVGGDSLEAGLRSANALATSLKAGALLAPITIVEERTIGPSLGEGALAGMATAAVVGVALVAAFMGLIYRLGGIFAVVAALSNVGLVLAALSTMGAALTLPGIAGLILTVGMAVDANIVIQERIAEEDAQLRAAGVSGSRRLATSRGYGRAWSAILDSNVASFIAGVVCLEVGSGPVQSFAVTLLLGIVATLITAVFLTRLLHEVAFALWPGLEARPVSFPRLVPHREDRDLLRHGRALTIASAAVVAAIVAVGAIFGVPMSVDFKGGVEATVTTSSAVSASTTLAGLEQGLVAAGHRDARVIEVQRPGADDEATTRREWQVRFDADGLGAAALQEIIAPAGGDVRVERVDSVDGAVADDLKTDGVLALCFTLAGIFVYVAWRFDRAFAPGAVIALLHDPLGALAVFVVGRLELDLPSIAALLTTVGYSISHTIVIYDRVRETMPPEPATGHPIEVIRDVVRRAVNDTLQRTVATTLTVLMTTVALWVWGGEALRPFSAALTVGCLVGAWSSLFMAPTIYLWWRERFPPTVDIVDDRPSREATAAGVV